MPSSAEWMSLAERIEQHQQGSDLIITHEEWLMIISALRGDVSEQPDEEPDEQAEGQEQDGYDETAEQPQVPAADEHYYPDDQHQYPR